MSNIEDFIEPYVDISANDFYSELERHKEFYSLRQTSDPEGRPKIKGTLLKHQKVIRRFISPLTPYNKLLLFHATGSGKTCSAIGVAENFKGEVVRTLNDGNVIETPRRALVIVKGAFVADNFIYQLVNICTRGEYLHPEFKEVFDDEAEETLGPRKKRLVETTQRERKIGRTKRIRKFYDIETFTKFARHIEKLSDNSIRDKYSNMVIIIDEAHNLRIQPQKRKETLMQYKQFHRFLHVVEGAKIILLTATPMRDRAEEIASLMNLLLPLDNQIPTDTKFRLDFLKDPSRLNILKGYFRGIVSYLRSSEEMAERINEGVRVWTKHLRLFPSVMEPFQEKAYRNAVSKDNEKKGGKGKAALAINTRQVSSFVFPDGSWGTKGFEKYVRKERSVIRKRTIFSLSSEVTSIVSGTTKQKLEGLRRLSSKYATVIKLILDSPKKLIFVYTELVMGSGALVFVRMLERFGFSESRGRSRTKRKRYTIITGPTATSIEARAILDQFNSPENSTGDFIQVLVGSRVVGEATTLKNVQQVHIMTPHWNNSVTEQAIGRTVRAFSHEDLPPSKRKVAIYRHACVLEVVKSSVTIDIRMYQLSEEKDIEIKKIERLLKESAVDCSINYLRNVRPSDLDYSRECDYDECEYDCEGVRPRGNTIATKYQLRPSELLATVWREYYTENLQDRIKCVIKVLFRVYYYLTTREVMNFLRYYDVILVTNVLKSLEISQEIMRNSYNLPCYLLSSCNGTDNEVWFLSPVSTPKNKSMELYARNTSISFYYHTQRIVLSEFLKQTEGKDVCNLFRVGPKRSEIRQALGVMSEFIINHLIELSILVSSGIIKPTIKASQTLEVIGDIYKRYISKVTITTTVPTKGKVKGKYIVNRYLFKSKVRGPIRCLPLAEEGLTWRDCNDQETSGITRSFRDKSRKVVERLETNPLGFYGILDRGVFKIRSLLKEAKGRGTFKGRICTTWNRGDILDLIVRLSPRVDSNRTRQEILEKIEGKITSLKKPWFTSEELRKMSLPQLRALDKYIGLPVKSLCGVILKELQNRDLILVE